MIFVYHSNAKIVAVTNSEGESVARPDVSSIAEGLHQLAQHFRNEKIVWCHIDCKEVLNIKALNELFQHDKMVLSYRPDGENYFGAIIGYVEETLFVNVNKKVRFPTWQMSSVVGMIHAAVLNKIGKGIPLDVDFDYYLCSLAKLCMPLGILCYSEPKLLDKNSTHLGNQASTSTIYRFVKQHYKTQWIFLLFLNRFLYERKLDIMSCIYSLWYTKRRIIGVDLNEIQVKSSKSSNHSQTIDVIIPTIGRKNYLYDVLCDLKKQTHLPVKVIIVEQNLVENSESELDYLETETWPFIVEHIFTHQAGACNARNLALAAVESNWIFLADDDIRFENDFFANAFDEINRLGVNAVSFRCFQKGEPTRWNSVFQWSSFGSGCSIVASKSIRNCKFNLGYEFGFGEDSDFGMQIRNQGEDVLYFPEPSILHLKAPMGGFRTKPILEWHNHSIQPKPSPTVMLYKILHQTKEQILGYETTLFFKYYSQQKIKNPIKYYLNFQKQWQQSVYWANQLKNKK